MIMDELKEAPKAAEIGDKVSTSPPMPATTTEQEDMVTAGQRRVNIIWEKTQRFIALGVTVATLLINMFITVAATIFRAELSVTQLIGVTNLNALSMLITGFYFARTNHTNIGGIGRKVQDQTR